jgi:hypothetical protein
VILPLLAMIAGAAWAECPVSSPESSPVAVPNGGGSWYGSEALAVQLPLNGKWRGLGPAHRFRDKTWFWRRGYDSSAEPRPDLTVVGVKLPEADEPHRVDVGRATNAMGPGWEQMLTLVELPSAGCWRLTATYTYLGITETLTFVVLASAD